MVCPVLKLRETKQTFVKVGGGKVDFFQTLLSYRKIDPLEKFPAPFLSLCYFLLGLV
jgi:hypothetical protein